MKKVAVLLLTGAIGLSLASCADNPSPSPSVSPEQGSELNPYVGNTYSQQPDVRDYAYSWWPKERAPPRIINFLSKQAITE